jgi:4-amino-4-deoxy-L-arabinose transferase-like glycosyltransferase
MKKIDGIIFIFFLVLTFFLRFSSLFQSFIEWDEGLYLLVARSLLEGNPPYTAVWDNKPPGIYVLFSLALLLLGNSVFSIRILTCITIAITCYLLYSFGKLIGNNDSKIGILAGILYVIFSIQTDGLAGNTEIFLAPFVTLVFYLLFSDKANPNQPTNQKVSKFFTMGVLLGIALQIKQVVIFDFIALLIILGIRLYFQTSRGMSYLFRRILNYYTWLFIGLIIPFFIILLVFVINGHFDDYIYANFSANMVRVAGVGFPIAFFLNILKRQIFSNFLLWLCLFLTPFYLISFKDINREEKRNLIYLLVWFLMAFISVCLLKGVYNHYYLQLLPSLCLISSYLIIRIVGMAGVLDKKRRFLALVLILLNPLLTNADPYITRSAKSAYFRFVKGIDGWGDDYRVISKYLQERIKKEDYIYVVDLPPIVYFLVDAKIPTKYAFSFFIHDKVFSKFAGVNPLKELNFIMSKRPVYVIRSLEPPRSGPTVSTNNLFYAELDKYLEKYYVFESSTKDVKFYKLRKQSQKNF